MNTLSPSQTPLADLFPESNYAAYQPGDSVYIYFHRDDDKVQLIGIGFNAFDAILPSVKYNPPETLLDFPVNYGDNYNQTYYTINTISSPEPIPGIDSIKFKNTIFDETTVDAYGTLTTPLGTFETLRTKDVQISYDTVWALYFGSWIPYSASVDTSVSYSWWTDDNSIGFMLFSIDMDETGTNVSDVSYLIKSVQGIGDNHAAVANVYPNPVSDNLTIEFNKTVSGELMFFNQTGQEIEALQLTGSKTARISVSSYPAGVYFYRVTGHSGTTLYQGKFVKQ
jgi:hypothetical protein